MGMLFLKSYAHVPKAGKQGKPNIKTDETEMMNFVDLPTVNELQAPVCLQMAMQSLVTEVSGWESRPWLEHPESQRTVVPLVFS